MSFRVKLIGGGVSELVQPEVQSLLNQVVKDNSNNNEATERAAQEAAVRQQLEKELKTTAKKINGIEKQSSQNVAKTDNAAEGNLILSLDFEDF